MDECVCSYNLRNYRDLVTVVMRNVLYDKWGKKKTTSNAYTYVKKNRDGMIDMRVIQFHIHIQILNETISGKIVKQTYTHTLHRTALTWKTFYKLTLALQKAPTTNEKGTHTHIHRENCLRQVKQANSTGSKWWFETSILHKTLRHVNDSAKNFHI